MEEFLWKMGIFYRVLNQITSTFDSPFLQCNDTVPRIGKYHLIIQIKLDSGYWHIVVHNIIELRSKFHVRFCKYYLQDIEKY